jgi:hypothetical protein
MLGEIYTETSSTGTPALRHVAETQAQLTARKVREPLIEKLYAPELATMRMWAGRAAKQDSGNPKTLTLQPQDDELTFSACLLCAEPLIPRTVRSEEHGPATSCNSDNRGRLLHDPTTETVRGEGQVQRAI